MQSEAREIVRASGEALASPFVCGSRVNSLRLPQMESLLAIYEGLDVSMFRLDILLLRNLIDISGKAC